MKDFGTKMRELSLRLITLPPVSLYTLRKSTENYDTEAGAVSFVDVDIDNIPVKTGKISRELKKNYSKSYSIAQIAGLSMGSTFPLNISVTPVEGDYLIDQVNQKSYIIVDIDTDEYQSCFILGVEDRPWREKASLPK